MVPCLARAVEPALNHTQRPCLARVLDSAHATSRRLRAVPEASIETAGTTPVVADAPDASSVPSQTQARDRRANRRFLERIALCTTEKDFCVAVRV